MFTLQEDVKYLEPRHSLVLLREVIKSGRGGGLWTSKEIQGLTPMSRSTTYRAINELITHGFLVRVTRGVYRSPYLGGGKLLPLDMTRTSGV